MNFLRPPFLHFCEVTRSEPFSLWPAVDLCYRDADSGFSLYGCFSGSDKDRQHSGGRVRIFFSGPDAEAGRGLFTARQKRRESLAFSSSFRLPLTHRVANSPQGTTKGSGAVISDTLRMTQVTFCLEKKKKRDQSPVSQTSISLVPSAVLRWRKTSHFFCRVI